MSWINHILFFLVLIASHSEAYAASVEGHASCVSISTPFDLYPGQGPTEECGFSVKVNGEIDANTTDQVGKLLEESREWTTKQQHAKRQDTLIIDSPGGNLAASMAMGRMLRKERVHLFIPKGGECVSACIMILAGAVARFWGSPVKIGIHRPYFDQSADSLPPTPAGLRISYEQMLRDMREYLREMNVSERLADDMLQVEPAVVRYLSHDEMVGYGLTIYDPVEQETIDLEAAHAWGLDRREYMRRDAVRLGICAPLEDIDKWLACNDRVMKFGR